MPEVLDKPALEALSAGTRQDIIKCLSQRPYTATELSKKLGKHVTTVAEHLRMLEKAGLIQQKPDGHKWIYYTLTPRGQKLFQPKFYSWVVVLSVSILAFAAGIFEIFSSSLVGGVPAIGPSAQKAAEEAAGTAGTAAIPGAAPAATPVQAVAQPLPPELAIGIILIIAAVAGIVAALLLRKRH